MTKVKKRYKLLLSKKEYRDKIKERQEWMDKMIKNLNWV